MIFNFLISLEDFIMRISSIALTSLFIFTVFSTSVDAATKGYEKDAQGRMLVYRAQSSWWSIPSGVLLSALGIYVMYDARYGDEAKGKVGGSLRLSDFFPDVHRLFANVGGNISKEIK